MPRAAKVIYKGVLVECDPSIKAIIIKLDNDAGHAYIVEDLDDQTLVVRESRLAELKAGLDKVLAKTQLNEEFEEDDSDDE